MPVAQGARGAPPPKFSWEDLWGCEPERTLEQALDFQSLERTQGFPSLKPSLRFHSLERTQEFH